MTNRSNAPKITPLITPQSTLSCDIKEVRARSCHLAGTKKRRANTDSAKMTPFKRAYGHRSPTGWTNQKRNVATQVVCRHLVLKKMHRLWPSSSLASGERDEIRKVFAPVVLDTVWHEQDPLGRKRRDGSGIVGHEHDRTGVGRKRAKYFSPA